MVQWIKNQISSFVVILGGELCIWINNYGSLATLSYLVEYCPDCRAFAAAGRARYKEVLGFHLIRNSYRTNADTTLKGRPAVQRIVQRLRCHQL